MKIPTVTGLMDTSQLGYTLIHEHAVTCCDWAMRMCLRGQFCQEDRLLEMAVIQLKKAKAAGIDTIVDGTPINLGRDIRLIRQASERSGVRVIVSTGFYHQEDPWLTWKPREEIYGYLANECEHGVEETDILPGILKCAVDHLGLTDYIIKILGITAEAARTYHLPIFCHTVPELRHGSDILDIMEDHGVALENLIVGHSGDVDDVDYLESLLSRGCYLGMDRFGTVTATPGTTLERRVDTILRLCRDDWADRLLISHDYAPYTGFIPSWREASTDEALEKAVNFTYFEEFAAPMLLEKGLPEETLHKLTHENPRRFFEQRD
ncbi:phosphotriesterase [uncultured Oscillibacter sp.]|uniref:phosphotriesterase family protein n=1 Tax=uncultured Oscillibacter sp. TaxID=876091 RepID=UPI0026703A3D|nr:phosphotriesterase [uncultured Oscillibacter sp.]